MDELSAQRGILRTLGSAGLLVLSACLSIDNVTLRQAEDEPDSATAEPMDGDSSPADGADGDAGSDEPPKPAACTTVGDYKLDGIPIQRSLAVCEGDLVCIDGLCVPEPACESGGTTPCVFKPASAHGFIPLSKVMMDGFLYWLELGSFDTLRNYQYDGALVRTKVGEWAREEVLTGLDLYLQRDGVVGSSLLGGQGWLHVPVGDDEGRLVVSADGAQSYRLPASSGTFRCVDADGTAYLQKGATLRAFNPLLALDRAYRDIGVSSCIVRSGVLWTESSALYRTDLASGDSKAYRSVWRFAHATNDGLVAQLSYETINNKSIAFVSTATPGESATLRWTNVAGGTSASFGPHVFTDEDVFWARSSANRREAVILRASFVQSETPRVVAELHDVAIQAVSNPDFSGALWVTEAGVLWQHSKSGGRMHFAPFPAESPQP